MRALNKLVSLVLAGSLAACSESPTPADPLHDDAHPQNVADGSSIDASYSVGCALVSTMPASAADFFPESEQDSAAYRILQLGTACAAGNQSLTTERALQLLGLMETVLDQHQAGSAVAGSQLVNALLACTTSLCKVASLPGIDFAPALSTNGLFHIGGSDTGAAVARDAQPFLDFEGNHNTALWGVEVDEPWSTVTGVPFVLVYGKPEGSLAVQELNIGLRYDLKTFPDVEFAEGKLHVGICFASEINLPTIDGADAEPAMRREGILLKDHAPGFCPAATQTASLGRPFAALARLLMPDPLHASLLAKKAGAVGGTPLDFSRFAPVASNTHGTLEWVAEPDAVVTEGESIGEIRIRARTGDGTPIEGVQVSLYIQRNRGVPAGAVLSGDLESITQELNGGIAVFPDDGNVVTVGKPGGYKLCATATRGSFTFTEICTTFHARNANKPKK